MTRAIAAAAIVVVVWSASMPAGAAAQVRDASPPPDGRAGTIAGTVVRADDERQTIRAAQVAVIGTASGITRVTTTSDDGTFTIAGLPSDRYNVGATKLPYLAAMAGARRPARPGSVVVLAAGQAIGDVKIRLYPSAAMTGVIRDPSGEPAMSVTVALMRWRIRNGERLLATPLVTATVETDDRGRYRFFGLPPGEYVVVAMRSGATAPHVLSQFDVDAVLSSKATGTRQIAEQHVPVYYPGTTRPADAAAVALGVGEEKNAIDFQIESVKPARLRVMLATADGRPFTTADVIASSLPDSIAAQQVSAPNRGAAAVEIGNLRPDTLQVTAIAKVDGQSRIAASTIEVAGGTEQTLSLVLRPAATVVGRVVLDAASATLPPLIGHRVGFRGLTGTPRGESQPTAEPAAESGAVSFTGVVAGRYTISGAGPRDWALQSVVVDGRDVTDRVIEISADTPPKEIVVTYTDRWQDISGRLQLANGAPVNDYTVVVIPVDPSRWPFGTRRILTARPGTNGQFILGGRRAATLPAGDCLLAAVTDIESDDLADPTFLAALVQAAIPVTLKPGEREVQDLAVR